MVRIMKRWTTALVSLGFVAALAAPVQATTLSATLDCEQNTGGPGGGVECWATASGGTAPYTFNWYQQYSSSGPYYFVSSRTGSGYDYLATGCVERRATYLRVDVVDANGATTTRYDAVYCSSFAP